MSMAAAMPWIAVMACAAEAKVANETSMAESPIGESCVGRIARRKMIAEARVGEDGMGEMVEET